ncbi:premnaspirodiene oxygenase-like [Solanum tuberosum]|uniref:premnaspirodiene oxygenase-like n=1 Tax=Solanum tuberosum TaxID=4113 RepID=UPI00073A3D8E|nr:PREDICTED: premnaspirodiene oxygenase-like [Solanum tuberosum]
MRSNMDMFLAGTETSADVLEWAMTEMMKNTKVMEKAQTELRRIPQGKKKIIVNAWAINRDAEFCEDSESFTLERFINCGSSSSNNLKFIGHRFEYLPFGGGRRMCPGISFGLSNVELPLAQLIYYFNWKMPDGMKPEDVDVTETPGASCSRKCYLCLLATCNDLGI